MKDTDIAWAAGLYEGEGSLTKRKTDKGAFISLNMTDKDVVEKIYNVTGVGSFFSIPSAEKGNRKPQWRWQVGKWEDVVDLLRLFLPYLGERRKKKVLQILSAEPPYRKGSKTHCNQGHKFTEENTYKYKGYISCKICRRERAKKSLRKKRADALNKL
jgi:hypothetical protein